MKIGTYTYSASSEHLESTEAKLHTDIVLNGISDQFHTPSVFIQYQFKAVEL
jgi:hypothetical protein